MSHQRRRGEQVTVWKSVEITDNRGNKVRQVDADGPYELRAAVAPQRSSRAEVPGQLPIDVVDILIDSNVDDVDLWSTVVRADGSRWDIVAPPTRRSQGARRTRHTTITLRKRPA